MKEIINWIRSYQDDPNEKSFDVALAVNNCRRYDEKKRDYVPKKRYEINVKTSDCDRGDGHVYYSWCLEEDDKKMITSIKSILRQVLPATITTPQAKAVK